MKTESEITARAEQLIDDRKQAGLKIKPFSSPAEKTLFSDQQHTRQVEIMALKWVLE